MNDPRLERYLGTLENSLRGFPVGDRAEIITEIRSHVLSALERDPTTRLDTILAAIGEPEMVANRYLLERGLKPTKPPISPIVKWLVIGFLATFAMILIFITYLVVWFAQGTNLDSDGNGFKFGNGAFKYDAKKKQISLSQFGAGDDFGGSVNVGKKVAVIFDSGHVDVSTSKSEELTWSCTGKGSSPNPKTVGEETTMDFSKVADLKCDVSIPKGRHLKINGEKGKIDLEQPQFSLEAKLDAGKIDFNGLEGTNYKVHAEVREGKADEFKSSDAPAAIVIDMRVDRGLISNEN